MVFAGGKLIEVFLLFFQKKSWQHIYAYACGVRKHINYLQYVHFTIFGIKIREGGNQLSINKHEN